MGGERAPDPLRRRSKSGTSSRTSSEKESRSDSCSSTSISEGSDACNAIPMIDGFAFFSLALHDHVKSKMIAAGSQPGGNGSSQQENKSPVTNEMVMNELRRLWKNMGDTQKQEWQTQALSIPATNFDSSSHNDDEDNDSQDSGTSSFASKQSTERRSNASDERRSDPGSTGASQGRSEEREQSAESRPTPAHKEKRTTEKRRKERRGEHRRDRTSNEEERSPRPAEDRRESGERASIQRPAKGHKEAQPVESAHQKTPPLVPEAAMHAQQQAMQGFAQAAGQIPMTQADNRALTQLMLANLQASSGGAIAQRPMQQSAMQQSAMQQSAMQAQMIGGAGFYNQQQAQLPNQNLQGNVTSFMLGNNLLPTMLGGLPAGNALLGPPCEGGAVNAMMLMQNNMYVNQRQYALPIQGQSPQGVLNAYLAPQMTQAQQSPMNPYLGISMAEAERLMGAQLGVSPGMLHAQSPGWPQGGDRREAGEGGGGAPQKRKMEAVQPSGITLEPEAPQVRTMTFVCDLLSPYEGQIDLEILAEDCDIVDSAPGIVGLSCQLQNAEGTRVVKRGQVKEARRHFAHQAQLRLSLASSPNISLKVFSTGRLQIAGCRDEDSCMEAVKLVAHAVNEIHRRRPEVMKRQTKTDGTVITDPIDDKDLPCPQIVMINCSFDSGMAAVGSALDPHRLTELLHEMQRNSKAVEEVSYNPEQRYTGVKVKFKPNVNSPNGEEEQTAIDREVFIGMFPSGKAVITGAVRWEEVERSYEFAKSVLCGHFDLLRVPVEDMGRNCRKKARGKAY